MQFKYKGVVDKTDQFIEGGLRADSEEEVYEFLERIGVTPYKISRVYIDFGKFDGNFTSREAMEFLREILSLLKSGLSPLEAIEYMASTTVDNKKFKQVGFEAYNVMKNGGTIVEGLRTGGFPKQYSDLLSIGEKTGAIKESVEIEIKQIELAQKIKKGFNSIFVAPAVSGAFMLIATIAVIIWLAPMQKKIIYQLVNSPSEVPPISASAFWISDYGIQIIVGFVVLLILFFILKAVLSRIFTSVAMFFDLLSLSIPVFGSFYKNSEYAKISYALTLSMGSGGRQSTVLSVMKDNTSSIFFKEKLEKAYYLVENEGLLISDAFDEIGINKLLALTMRRGEMLDKKTAMELMSELGDEFSTKSLYNMEILKGASEMTNMMMLSILSIPVLMISVAPSIDQVTLMMNKF